MDAETTKAEWASRQRGCWEGGPGRSPCPQTHWPGARFVEDRSAGAGCGCNCAKILLKRVPAAGAEAKVKAFPFPAQDSIVYSNYSGPLGLGNSACV